MQIKIYNSVKKNVFKLGLSFGSLTNHHKGTN